MNFSNRLHATLMDTTANKQNIINFERNLQICLKQKVKIYLIKIEINTGNDVPHLHHRKTDADEEGDGTEHRGWVHLPARESVT